VGIGCGFGFGGDAAAARGAIVDAIDLLFGDGDLLVLLDHDEIVGGGFVQFDQERLRLAVAEDAEFGAGFEVADFLPGVVGGGGGDEAGKKKNGKVAHGGKELRMRAV